FKMADLFKRKSAILVSRCGLKPTDGLGEQLATTGVQRDRDIRKSCRATAGNPGDRSCEKRRIENSRCRGHAQALSSTVSAINLAQCCLCFIFFRTVSIFQREDPPPKRGPARNAKRMRLFVSYSYSTRDQWIEEFVFPLVIALGCEVV